MPQASRELRDKFPGHDAEAIDVLKQNFEWGPPRLWEIRRKDKNYSPTPREFDAIDYLCDEWDWGWSWA